VTASSPAIAPGQGTVAGETPLGYVQGRLDTTLIGVLLFITSEVMFFAGLFAAYFTVRAAHGNPWPPEGFHPEIEIALILLGILLTSSFTMEYALRRIKRGDRTGLVRGLTVTVVLGALFLIGQLYDYATLGFGVSSGIYGTVFYTLTGFHGAHVFGGVVAIAVMLFRGAAGQFSERHHAAIEGVSWYWHFVDIVWIGLVTTLYVLPILEGSRAAG
jgi:cytochrome c oxidase subunit 3